METPKLAGRTARAFKAALLNHSTSEFLANRRKTNSRSRFGRKTLKRRFVVSSLSVSLGIVGAAFVSIHVGAIFFRFKVRWLVVDVLKFSVGLIPLINICFLLAR